MIYGKKALSDRGTKERHEENREWARINANKKIHRIRRRGFTGTYRKMVIL